MHHRRYIDRLLALPLVYARTGIQGITYLFSFEVLLQPVVFLELKLLLVLAVVLLRLSNP